MGVQNKKKTWFFPGLIEETSSPIDGTITIHEKHALAPLAYSLNMSFLLYKVLTNSMAVPVDNMQHYIKKLWLYSYFENLHGNACNITDFL